MLPGKSSRPEAINLDCSSVGNTFSKLFSAQNEKSLILFTQSRAVARDATTVPELQHLGQVKLTLRKCQLLNVTSRK
jgi:hypothetical protein